ncbi:MAG: Sec-independent protein translocase subunit TatA/TatB [Verrucomicrobiota bacterium]
MMPGPKEWFFIFLIILLIFGAKRIPEIMRALGRGLGEFRKARDDFEEALSSSTSERDNTEKPPAESTENTRKTNDETNDETNDKLDHKPSSSA